MASEFYQKIVTKTKSLRSEAIGNLVTLNDKKIRTEIERTAEIMQSTVTVNLNTTKLTAAEECILLDLLEQTFTDEGFAVQTLGSGYAGENTYDGGFTIPATITITWNVF